MTETPEDYKHDKCYANNRGGCSTKISGEHYVSHGLIKLYGNNDPAFTIQHKTGKGVGHPVKPKEFKANILCTNHNNALRPADDTALEFAKFIRRNALNYHAGAGDWGAAEEITISGDNMQRWVLKLFLNHAVTQHFAEQQDKGATFPEAAIDLLLDRAIWPVTWGLTVPGDLTNKDVRYCPFQTKEVVDSHWWGVAPFVHKDQTWLGGGIVDLCHVSFGLTLFNPGRYLPSFNNPGNPLRGSLQRPSHIGWELDGVEKRINFTWTDPWPHHGIIYTLRPQNKTDRLAGRLPEGHRIWLE